MVDTPQVTWISYAAIKQYGDPCKSLQEPDRRPHRLAIAQSIRERRIWVSGSKHHATEEKYVPLVDGRWAYHWSDRGRGDLMACIWSLETGANYDYFDFFLSAPASPWGDPEDWGAWGREADDSDGKLGEDFFALMEKHAEERAREARTRLLEAVDCTYETVRDARALLSPAERIRALKIAVVAMRRAPPLARMADEPRSSEPDAHEKHVAAAALAVYLAEAVAKLDNELPESDERAHRRTEDLYCIMLVQRSLEEAKPARALRSDLLASGDGTRAQKREK